MKQEIKNCAIYCRKSTEEGLDQDFNSLDAQRESCAAYIISQKAEGWKQVKAHYDDGGYSGGNLERPGLQKLLNDIKEGKIQTVVVYKIDRLTRSLMDFAKLVEVFDGHGVTFVSVTQSFNTTTSMGRLTLNVLLSFAQFEREVSAERIRDKITASKKKGMWMGGNPPIGYDAVDKKLIVNKDDSKIARHIFERYLSLGSVAALKNELDKNGVVSKKRTSKRGNITGGKPYSRGALYTILQNPIYIGKIRHKDQNYDGQHEAIISQDLWNAVQNKLASQSATKRGHKKSNEKNLLKGLLFDEDGTPYSPEHTKKGNKHYRYYISQNLIQYRDHPKELMARLPAFETEKFVIKVLKNKLSDKDWIQNLFDFNDQTEHVHADFIVQNSNNLNFEILITKCLKQIIIYENEMTLDIDPKNLRAYLSESFNIKLALKSENNPILITMPFYTRRSHKGAIIIESDGNNKDPFDLPSHELKKFVKGTIWRDEHFSGATLTELSTREKVSKQHIRALIMKSMELA